MPRRLSVTVALAAFGLAPSLAWASPAECMYAYASQPNLPRFGDYPASPFHGRLRPPQVAAGEARQFRSEIRQGAAAGPNFAGHYSIVGWGCGASCQDWALVDRADGRVFLDGRYRDLSTAQINEETARKPPGLNTSLTGLRFRLDSRLLVVQGAPQEDETREGLTFLEWTGRAFRQVAFVPATRLCL